MGGRVVCFFMAGVLIVEFGLGNLGGGRADKYSWGLIASTLEKEG